MRKLVVAMAVVIAALYATDASAQDAGHKKFAVGGYMGLGLTTLVGDDLELYGDEEDKPRFSGGGAAYFDFYLMEILGLEAGIGFFGKGGRWDVDDDPRIKIQVLEIFFGAKLNIKGFQAAVLIALDIGLKIKIKDDDSESSDDDYWDYYRRFNLGPKIVLGYAIPVGPISLVPGVSWYIDLINGVNNEEIEDDWGYDPEWKIRGMTLLFHVGAEFGF